ncbi:MAG TPA: TraR/DksA C4-type zinc finger protein [Lacipirellulaceae bacterium]|jgi:RNA polymerase-binding transcription factor DksA|nr:TraR/DksA C4-type zinc finger protein [Lacipirellulaceae bacterium]
MNSKSFSEDKYRTILQQLASRVGTDANSMVEQVRAGASGKGGNELTNAPLHLGDMGTDEFMYDMNATLLVNEQYIVSEIRDALARIENGKFGVCESCGKAIAPARLEAIPYTRYCVDCAALQDETPQVSLDDGRPHSPKDTLAPEGDMEEDRLRRGDSLEFPISKVKRGDVFAAGTAGGGTAVGGLAGSNEGNGDPSVVEVDDATGSGNFDIDDDRVDDHTPQSGFRGGAVGGTPARKRAK